MNPQKKPVRRTVLTQAKRAEICAILAVGCSRATAARYVGCHPDTIRKTALRDEEFADLLEQAESKHEVKHLALIDQAAKDSKYWRAAAWALERRYPGRYGVRKPDTLTFEQVTQVLAQFAEMVLGEVADPEIRQRILERLAGLTASLEPPPVQETDG